MKIRKYYARNISEGFLKVKKELGPEAIILQTRKVRQRGLKGWFMPRQVEVIAALDSRGVLPPPGQLPGTKRIEEELSALKNMVQTMVEKPKAEKEKAEEAANGANSNHYWRSYLIDHDVDPVIIENMFAEMETPEKNSGGREIQTLFLREKVVAGIPMAEERKARIVAFIGPTGVGKTTTLAKLAARYALGFKEKVGLITIDHFRIGAVDQLRAYAEIMDLPLEVALTPSDLAAAVGRLKDCDRILVDTAGRSTGNFEGVKELADYLAVLPSAEIHLVISATTRWQDIRFITASFSKLNYNRLLITKLDETASYGAILNGAYYANQPLVYVANGQSVPDHLKLAREVDWAGLFWGAK